MVYNIKDSTILLKGDVMLDNRTTSLPSILLRFIHYKLYSAIGEKIKRFCFLFSIINFSTSCTLPFLSAYII